MSYARSIVVTKTTGMLKLKLKLKLTVCVCKMDDILLICGR